MFTQCLPFDIIHTVISREADRNTLKAWSLVSRLWHEKSRPYLWKCVHITSGEELSAFLRLVDNAPDIAGFVQELVVRPNQSSDAIIPLPTPWIAQFPDALSSRLASLRTITLACIYDYGEYLDHDFFHRLSAFATVDSLVLRECGLTEHFIFSFIAAFPHLRHLRISSLRPLASMLGEAPPLLHQPRLVSISLEIGNKYPSLFESLLQWLLTSPTQSTLRAFSGIVHILDSAITGTFLRAVGNVLERLELRLLKLSRVRIEYQGECSSTRHIQAGCLTNFRFASQ